MYISKRSAVSFDQDPVWDILVSKPSGRWLILLSPFTDITILQPNQNTREERIQTEPAGLTFSSKRNTMSPLPQQMSSTVSPFLALQKMSQKRMRKTCIQIQGSKHQAMCLLHKSIIKQSEAKCIMIQPEMLGIHPISFQNMVNHSTKSNVLKSECDTKSSGSRTSRPQVKRIVSSLIQLSSHTNNQKQKLWNSSCPDNQNSGWRVNS